MSPKHQSSPKQSGAHAIDRSAVIDALIAGYDALMHDLAGDHAPEFLEIDVTMPQAKLVYLLGASGDLHMSELVARLGVSLSTVSGLVDRVVDHGLVNRREDPVDRRHVVVGLTPAGKAFIERFRELGAVQMRELLDLLDDTELDSVRRTLAALSRASAIRAARRPRPTASSATAAPRKDPA